MPTAFATASTTTSTSDTLVCMLRKTAWAGSLTAEQMACVEADVTERFVMTLLNERLGMFISLVEYDRMLDTRARLARCLAALFNPHLNPGISSQLKISQEELGNLCNASRQRVNGSLKALEKAGLVKAEYDGITILDLNGLRKFQS